jgi:hypothetical protein
MAEPQEELFEIADRLERLANDAKEPRAEDSLAALEDAANTIGKGWRGSWLIAILVFTTKISSRRLPGHISAKRGDTLTAAGLGENLLLTRWRRQSAQY